MSHILGFSRGENVIDAISPVASVSCPRMSSSQSSELCGAIYTLSISTPVALTSVKSCLPSVDSGAFAGAAGGVAGLEAAVGGNEVAGLLGVEVVDDPQAAVMARTAANAPSNDLLARVAVNCLYFAQKSCLVPLYGLEW